MTSLVQFGSDGTGGKLGSRKTHHDQLLRDLSVSFFCLFVLDNEQQINTQVDLEAGTYG